MAADRIRTNEDRVRFPLWLKLGATFGCVVAGALIAVQWHNLEQELEGWQQQQTAHQLGLAQATAILLDGEVLDTFRRGPDMQRPEYGRILGMLRSIRHAAGVRWLGIYGRRGERYFYLIDGEDEDPLPLNYPLFDVTPALRRALDEGKPGVALSNEDEWGRWDSAYAPVVVASGTPDERVAGVVCVDVDAAWKQVLRRARLRDGALQITLASLAVIVASILFSRTLVKHLKKLMAAANAVASGNLDQTVDIEVRDEIGVVARTFDRMLLGLKERDAIRDAFGRYVDPEVARQILADPDSLRPGGELRTVTILMSDLRGFTSLSERHTPAEMVELLNAYLGRMADVIARHRGTVNEFIGDAVLALFGAPVSSDDDALRAVACAAEMQIELERFNVEHPGADQLKMGIGVNTGQVIVGNIGSDRHMKYGVVGDAVNMAARVESFTVGGEVLMSEPTHAAVAEHVDVRGPFFARAKGKKEPLGLYSLLWVAEPYDLRVPIVDLGDQLADVSIPVDCYAVRGKEIDEEPMRATLIRLGRDDAEVLVERALAVFDNVKLRLRPEGEAPLEDVYAKVTRAEVHDGEHLCRLRFTSVPDPDRLEALAPAPPPPAGG